MIEIERKYLVKNDSYKLASEKSELIKQGFLNSDKERTVRIRIKDNKGFITVKGISNLTGTSRFEWEKEISKDEAESLIELCEPGVINKTRYLVSFKNQLFEIDEFYGENKGLVIAEIELKNENQPIILPEWIDKEVTGDIRYYNSSLSKNPYKNWK